MKILREAADVTPEILDAVEETVEWFQPGETMTVEEFLDRLCTNHGDGWDIENYYNPAVRKIMRHARAVRKETA